MEQCIDANISFFNLYLMLHNNWRSLHVPYCSKELEQLQRIRAIQHAHDKAAFNNVFQKGDWFSEEDAHADREGTTAKMLSS